MICFTYLRRVIGPIGGAWIPYTAAQVAARRALQIVAITVCISVPVPSGGALPPLPHLPPSLPHTPIWQPLETVPRVYTPIPVYQVPEPTSALVLAVALAALVWKRHLVIKLKAV